MIRKGLVCVLAAILAAGCAKRKQEEADAGKPTTPAEETRRVCMEAFGLVKEGDTNAALTVLSDALADTEREVNRPYVFANFLWLLLRADRIDEAEAEYLRMAGEDERAALLAFNALRRHVQIESDHDLLLRWTQAMLDTELTPRLTELAVRSQVDLCVRDEAFDRLPALVGLALERLEDAAALTVFEQLMGSLLEGSHYDQAREVMAAIEAAAEEDTRTRSALVPWRIRLAGRQGRWEEVHQALSAEAAGLTDNQLQSLVQMLTDQGMRQSELHEVDRICEFVLAETPSAVKARGVAASQWVAVAKKRGEPTAVLDRISGLLDAGIEPGAVLKLYRDNFYDLTAEEGEAFRRAVLAFGGRLKPLLAGTKGAEEIDALAMDGYVMLDDYEGALAILEGGFRMEETEWHEMAVNKVKAHIALQQGHTDEAVRRFRTFMAHLKSMNTPATDPVTGLRYSPEMNLGNNAKRIGDILKSAGQDQAAARAYEEARTYYEQAVNQVKENSPEARAVREAMAELPGPGEEG